MSLSSLVSCLEATVEECPTDRLDGHSNLRRCHVVDNQCRSNEKYLNQVRDSLYVLHTSPFAAAVEKETHLPMSTLWKDLLNLRSETASKSFEDVFGASLSTDVLLQTPIVYLVLLMDAHKIEPADHEYDIRELFQIIQCQQFIIDRLKLVHQAVEKWNMWHVRVSTTQTDSKGPLRSIWKVLAILAVMFVAAPVSSVSAVASAGSVSIPKPSLCSTWAVQTQVQMKRVSNLDDMVARMKAGDPVSTMDDKTSIAGALRARQATQWSSFIDLDKDSAISPILIKLLERNISPMQATLALAISDLDILMALISPFHGNFAYEDVIHANCARRMEAFAERKMLRFSDRVRAIFREIQPTSMSTGMYLPHKSDPSPFPHSASALTPAVQPFTLNDLREELKKSTVMGLQAMTNSDLEAVAAAIGYGYITVNLWGYFFPTLNVKSDDTHILDTRTADMFGEIFRTIPRFERYYRTLQGAKMKQFMPFSSNAAASVNIRTQEIQSAQEQWDNHPRALDALDRLERILETYGSIFARTALSVHDHIQKLRNAIIGIDHMETNPTHYDRHVLSFSLIVVVLSTILSVTYARHK